MVGIKWFALVAVFLQLTLHTGALNIASFNIQVFGRTKAGKEDVMNTLVKIIHRYDILLIQEIRDKYGRAIQTLLDKVNQRSNTYNVTISERLGRSSNKEQYAFMYRQDRVAIRGTYQYEDPGDKFEREPYAVRIFSKHSDVQEFVLVGVHIKPSMAVLEISELIPTLEAIKRKWRNSNILLMGDLNADCSYVNRKELVDLKEKLIDLYWLIPDDADTTVRNTDCAYDRFIISGEELMEAVVPNSVGVFRFDKEYRLDLVEAAAVSDHYPIEVTLKSSSRARPSRPDIPSAAVTHTGLLQTTLYWLVNNWGRRTEL